MTPQEYRDAIAALGLTQVGAARFLGVNEKTSRDWADLRMSGPPEPVARFLLFLIYAGISPDRVTRVLERRR